MVNLFQKTQPEINRLLADRMIAVRKRRKLSQKELSVRSGVSLGSLKRFEHTGEISLASFTKLAIALRLDDELCALFEQIPYTSIEELIHEQS